MWVRLPFLPEAWEKMLCQHHDRAFSRCIVQGIMQGFHIGSDGKLCQPLGMTTNMCSADLNPAPAGDYLSVELATERIAEMDKKSAQGIILSVELATGRIVEMDKKSAQGIIS